MQRRPSIRGSQGKPEETAGHTSSPDTKIVTQRLQSLDVLRGSTVAVMILVNTSGDGAHTYPLLAHSPWNGCTLADVVFPCFLFMVGVSCVFSIDGKLARGEGKTLIVASAARRAAILFAFGLAINGFPMFSLHTLRVMGVLQRIALCYLAATLVLLFSKTRTISVLLLAILIGYWILLRWVPVPGMGTPGNTIPFLDPHANLPAWLDRNVIPANHLYHLGYYDPEGILSTVPAIGSTLLGVLTGVWLRTPRSLSGRARGLLLASCVCLASGLIWSHWFPLNTRLWTSSFVVWTGGTSLLALWPIFWLVDVRHRMRRAIAPAIVFGKNALAAYIFSEFLAALLGSIKLRSGTSLQHWLFHPLAAAFPSLQLAAVAYAGLFVALCFVPIWALHRLNIFLKV
jgi:predicted acyltransferase